MKTVKSEKTDKKSVFLIATTVIGVGAIVCSLCLTGLDLLDKEKYRTNNEIIALIDMNINKYIDNNVKKPNENSSVSNGKVSDKNSEVHDKSKDLDKPNKVEKPKNDNSNQTSSNTSDKVLPKEDKPLENEDKSKNDTKEVQPDDVKTLYSQKALEAVGIDINNVYKHPNGYYVYTIQKGDTLSKISSAFGTSIDSLAELNQIENVDLIYAGSALRLPQ